MSKQIINIGIEGNDGTGDAIRDAFRKANENFTELYAVFGQGGQITFSALSDTPASLGSKKIPISNDAGNAIEMRTITGGTGMAVDLTTNSDAIILNSTGTTVDSDATPGLGGPLNGNTFPIGNISITDQAVIDYNTAHGANISIDDLVINKKYADQRYLKVSGGPSGASGQLRVRNEPTDGSEYTLTITAFNNGDPTITNHGFDAGSNGLAFIYNSTATDAVNLVSESIYYIRYIDVNTLSLHASVAEATNDDDSTRVKISASGGSGTQTLADNEYDSTLTGNWLSSEALPRKAIVRRQGDTMEGILNLFDHPGAMAGLGRTYPDAYANIVANREFLADEVMAWFDTAYPNVHNQLFSVSAATYSPASGVMELTVGSHTLQAGTTIKIDANSLTFTCALDSHATNHTYPRATGSSAPGGYDPVYNTAIAITGVTATTITVNVGISSDTSAHTFVSATSNCISTERHEKCERDTKFNIDAIAHDVKHGGNAEIIRVSKYYWEGASSQLAAGEINYAILINNKLRDFINTNIIPNVALSTNQNPVVTTQTTTTKNGEAGADTKVTSLVATINNITENGLDVIPTPTPAVDVGDLQAATKKYVDSAVTHSATNLFVNTKGDDSMEGIPQDKWGRTLGTAYATIGAAAARAEEIMNTTPYEPGPWRQVITYNNGANDSTITSSGVDNSSGYGDVKLLIDANRQFIIEEAVASTEASYPTHVNFGTLCRRDLGYALDGLIIDIINGLNANYQAILVGQRFYNSNSGLYAITTQKDQTLHAIGYAKQLVNYILTNTSPGSLFQTDYTQTINNSWTVDANGLASAQAKFTIIENIVTNGLSVSPALVDGSTWEIKLDNGGTGNVDPNPTNSPDLIAGKMVRGLTTHATGKVVSVTQGASVDTVLVDLLEPKTFAIGEKVEFAQPIREKHIAIKVESGVYYEDLPIKLPDNVSLQGDEMRRSIIRPRDRISQSPWVRMYFYRDLTFDGLTIATQNYGYHYLSDTNDNASTPKNNKELDILLLNNSSIIKNITFQGHGGFAQVLDPEGAILTKSPYTFDAACYSQSINAKAFRGGMYIDAFAGNLPTKVTNVVSPFILDVTSDAGTGLRIRKPMTPCPFYIDGDRYQINAIKNYDQANGTAQLLLDSTSNSGNGWTGAYSPPYSINVQTAGNKSALGHAFTQINDLGYGIVVTNSGLSELVSCFTYFCQTGMYANQGGKIRSLNSSCCHGTYGLVSSGSDPNESVDPITLTSDMVQTALARDDGASLTNPSGALSIYVFDLDYVVTNNSEVEVDHGGVTGVIRYEVTTIETTTETAPASTRDSAIYKINLGTSGKNETSTTGLKQAIADDQTITIRANSQFVFGAVDDPSPTKPTTAIVFDETPTVTYRSISYSTSNPVGVALPANSALIAFDDVYDYIKVVVNDAEAQNSTHAGAGTTMGHTVGDVVIAIDKVAESVDIARLNNGDMTFGWDGKTHKITSYTDRTTYATIEITDVSNINPTPIGAGIHSPMSGYTGSSGAPTLRVGLSSTEPATITVFVSTLRASNHDFLDIGTGGWNSTNFPNVIYGAPTTAPAQANETLELDKGRIYYVSTDQDGFFRVGKYFTVDQATGTVSFAAAIAISNLDGIGFKRGVVVAEFSTDGSMIDNSTDTVPTESAVRQYVNRRLGFDHANTLVGNPIGAGAVARDGSAPFTANVGAGGHKLIDLSDPSADQDAATKSYTDSIIYETDQIEDIRNINISSLASGHLLVFNGAYRLFSNPASGGNFAASDVITGSVTGATGTITEVEVLVLPGGVNATRITFNWTSSPTAFTTADIIDTGGGVTAQVIDAPMNEVANAVMSASSDVSITATRGANDTEIDFQIESDVIVNADVKSDAAIAQSKLNLNAATTRANASGISQADLGVASFDSSTFTITDGWVEITPSSLTFSDLPNLAQNEAYARTAVGSGSASAISFDDIISGGGAVIDSDFVTEVGQADDPGEALIKIGAGQYKITNVSKTGESNSIIKSDGTGVVNISSLSIDSNPTMDVVSSTLEFHTPGGIKFLSGVGSTSATTVVDFIGKEFSLNHVSTGDASASNSQEANDAALAVSHLYTKFIESEEKDTDPTGIGLGQSSAYVSASDTGTEGRIALVADGVVPVLVTATGIIPDADVTYNIGTSTRKYNTMYATTFEGTATSAQYADLAEKYIADNEYDPGTVIIFGGDKEVTTTQLSEDTRVAGVVSDKPAYLMNSEQEGGTAIALQGRVKVKIAGMCRKGDMLVTSSIRGYASSSPDPRVGTVLGKALEDHKSPGQGVIEMVVGRV